MEELSKIGLIEGEYRKKGKRYADWQKEKYHITTEAKSGDYKKSISLARPAISRSAKWEFGWSKVCHPKRKKS